MTEVKNSFYRFVTACLSLDRRLYIILAAVILGCIAYNIPPWRFMLNGIERKGYYFIKSFAVFLFALALYKSIKHPITFIAAGFTLNDFLDDLFFNPEQLQVNEYILAVCIVIYSIWFKKYSSEKDYSR